MIDLHSHTTASDGQYAPEDQVALAARAGITVLGVTDHDSVAGLEACAAAAKQFSIRLIPGIEISCIHNRREVHLLGHFIDPLEVGLREYVVQLVDERTKRMEHMLKKLVDLGVPVTMDQVRVRAAGAPPARPHLARVLVDLCICSSIKEAFDRFLGDGQPAWVPRFELSTPQAIAIIHGSGGTATVAHPGSSRINHLELSEMAEAGLDGIESIHSDHPPSQRELFQEWAKELNLCCTAGSDFHGPEVAPSRHFGTVGMALDEFRRLELRRREVVSHRRR